MRGGRCPRCGEAVSQFAAGCAVCGADLEAHRDRVAARAARRPAVQAPTVPDWLRPRMDADAALLSVTVTALLLFPLLGVVLALVGANDRNKTGQLALRNGFLALALVGGAMLLVPALRIGVLSLLFGG